MVAVATVNPGHFPIAPEGVPATTVFPSTSNPQGTPGPPYSGTFIPELWSGRLIEKFYASTVLVPISNTNYEGEIRQHGDTVNIRTRPTITIRDYTADTQITVERPTSDIVILQINKAKYFATIVDDVMVKQSDLNLMSIWADDASQQMKIKIDTQVLKDLLGTPDAANKGTAAGKISGASGGAGVNLGATGSPLTLVARNATTGQVEILDALLRLGQCLDEQNVPEQGRWVVLPAWAAAKIKGSELRDAALTGDSASVLRNGRLGMIDRFTLYVSNLLPAGTAAGLAAGEFGLYAGHPNALTFASQMTKLETVQSEFTFGTVMRGLQVFGYKVIDPTAICQAIVTQ